ncbi:MAG TPA: phosphoglucomutase [Lachnoclostridium phytofermentans]|uniref:Phosphoglucomutase n=1 Tax=Lachnoclostridium phytofermentans TaxID=66219 RepID=A0A3D2XAK2_9FIRM|nr:phospho-sugar mutase [Lachnoclostridium sp.]HCL04006.1 phosphoglucomutase [Lachnoclostridium phytofermentans]
MNYLDTYRFWCEDAYFDEKTKAELKNLEGNDIEIKDRFYKSLEFGTGGLRGIIGAGTNRMNLYTVRKATQGLANFIKKEHGEDRGVAIAYDSRNMSIEFSEEVALCLCANGIKAYRFESLRPTPELSFALRTLNCISGIVITASHNPPEYNGYKVYWEDGAQITYPKDEQIINEVNNVTDFNTVKTMNKEDAIAAGLYHIIGKEIDDLYIAELKKQVIHPDVIKKVGGDLKIVYTPLHGTGNIPARRVLSELGFENVYVVPEQELPDGNFSTVGYPNPEDPKAFKLALDLAKKVDADLVLATDPDADRLGVYAKDSKSGDYISFTGNMSGMLICEYLLSQRKEKGTIAKDGALIKTIVSTNMADKVAQEYNIQLIEVLTGFKYIGEQIKLFEETGKGTYEFGFEESYGCLIGTHARDKDAIVAVMALCEAAAYYSTKGLTLWDQMLNIYKKYGYFREGLETMTLKGVEGAEKIKEMMDGFRQNPPKQLGNYRVVSFRDYETDKAINLDTNEVSKTGLPKSNVLYFELDNDAWVCVRPSGTEPKIKFYIGVKGTSTEDANEQLKSLTDALMKLA